VDSAGAEFFGVGTKITTYRKKQPTLPLSRARADEVSSTRSFRFFDKLVRNMKGKGALDVSAPLRIDEHRTLLFIAADHKKQPRGLVYDMRDFSVSFPETALSTLTANAVNGDIPEQVLQLMDATCNEFLLGMRRKPVEDSAEGKGVPALFSFRRSSRLHSHACAQCSASNWRKRIRRSRTSATSWRT